MTTTIANNYRRLCDDVHSTMLSAGRDPNDITIVVVSKRRPLSHIIDAYHAGCRDFGENYVQEALTKISGIPHELRPNWHFIGNLQRNKVRKIVGLCPTIHAVDSLQLAEKISQVSAEQNTTTRILIQVNTSNEKSKHGTPPSHCSELCLNILNLPNIELAGLMTMAPNTTDTSTISNCFSLLRTLKEQLAPYTPPTFAHLSMGMSNDYHIAINEGATILRIGSSLFVGDAVPLKKKGIAGFLR